jgi:hypothetical protein
MAEPPKNPFLEALRRERKAQQRARNRIRNRQRRHHRDPAQLRAWKAVERAVGAGQLVKEPCQIGFSGCKRWPVQFHHESYEAGRELEGRWACKMCHGKLSARQKARRRTRQTPPEAIIDAPGVIVLDDPESD